eukprot:6769555-Pyramimonas_sp.AAC.1
MHCIHPGHNDVEVASRTRTPVPTAGADHSETLCITVYHCLNLHADVAERLLRAVKNGECVKHAPAAPPGARAPPAARRPWASLPTGPARWGCRRTRAEYWRCARCPPPPRCAKRTAR